MKVVLNQDVKGLGKKLDTVEVSEGYARNFLLPKKLANLADTKSLNEAQTKKEAIKYKKDTEKQDAETNRKLIESKYIEFRHKIGENGRLFGSVTEKEISEEVEKKFNIKVDKRKIIIDENIKVAGSYVAQVKLYEGVVAKLKIVVLGV
ncbi:MAG: 50S ribosomal protein L9 [Clostridia bacterium]|nr:50S ribosomal protein L9 [Clostridia bacterium]